MTMPVMAEQGVRLRWRRSLAARCATGVARPLVLLKPKRLRALLLLWSRGAAPATAAQALAAREAVVTVSARCAGQGCLQRSVATALLCRLGGRWPDWCTGVRLQPFRAHAWVEAEGAAVGESGDMSLYHTMLSVRVPRASTEGRS
ncbi:lasso peptide biosynthesis B2 protein [Actinoplanes sp. ATCC 53533]|uniref:lasso peptide biosynthesis B2 protein n=1 Tax=Actinoplanes sp. ATCC 53533 TaxID=1288362 RepID=UPI000F783F12|nr:lasso peptide biosynthesis B2 protein [Actinoplanes sp. ATCC 53533]RSM59778.1 lasso peptide biosynthesis B2 protein [Actinoplanes sp. ATCC 53533]